MNSGHKNSKWKYTLAEPRIAHRYIHLDDNRPDVVVVHGGPGDNSAYLMASIGFELEKRYNVLWFDQRGCGNSRRNLVPDCYAPFNNVADIANLLEELNLKKIVVIGHSWGGMVAGMFAAEFPAKTAGLISVCGCASFPDMLSNLKKKLYARFAGRLESAPILLRDIEKMPSDFMKLVHLLDCARKTGIYYKDYLHTKKELERLNAWAIECKYYDNETIKDAEDVLLHSCDRHDLCSFEIYPYLRRVKLPALIIGGKHDGIIDLECVKKYAGCIPSSDICFFDDSGHNPFQEEPSKFMAIIGAFIENLRCPS